MELYTPERKYPMTHPHDLAIFYPGVNLQALREGGALHHKRVIAGSLKRIGQSTEQLLAVMMDGRGLAMHQGDAAHDIASEGCPDGLMAKTDAQDGDLSGEMCNAGDGNAGLFGRAGAGRDDEASGLKRFYFRQGDSVVAVNLHIFTKLAEVLNDVIGKGVVVVDHQQHKVYNLFK